MTAYNTTNNPIHNQIGAMAPLLFGKSRKAILYSSIYVISIDLGLFPVNIQVW